MNNIINFNSYTSEKGGVHMCMPINKIYRKNALDVLNEFGNPNDVPINLNMLLEKIGISALPMDFSLLEKK